jgi:hypothetical protein
MRVGARPGAGQHAIAARAVLRLHVKNIGFAMPPFILTPMNI